MSMVQMDSSGAGQRTGTPARQEVTFADGSSVWLHPSLQAGTKVCNRELALGDGNYWPIDLVRAAPELGFELPTATSREAASAVFHSLRKRFNSASEFRQAVGAPAP